MGIGWHPPPLLCVGILREREREGTVVEEYQRVREEYSAVDENNKLQRDFCTE